MKHLTMVKSMQRDDTDGRDNSLFIDSLYFAQLKLLLQFYKYFQAKPLFRYWILEIDNEKKTTIAHSFINTLLFKKICIAIQKW